MRRDLAFIKPNLKSLGGSTDVLDDKCECKLQLENATLLLREDCNRCFFYIPGNKVVLELFKKGNLRVDFHKQLHENLFT